MRAEVGGELEVVGDAGSVESAVAVIRAHEPDVVLLDVHMPDGGGVEVIDRVSPRAAERPLPRPVGVRRRRGRHRRHQGGRPRLRDEDDLERRARGGRAAGRRGDAVFSPRLAGFVLDAFAAERPPAGAHAEHRELDQLTPREREVLRHIARGYMYKEVAQRLGISSKTVEAHVSAVLRKLQLSSRHELSRWAVQRRLVSLDGP